MVTVIVTSGKNESTSNVWGKNKKQQEVPLYAVESRQILVRSLWWDLISTCKASLSSVAFVASEKVLTSRKSFSLKKTNQNIVFLSLQCWSQYIAWSPLQICFVFDHDKGKNLCVSVQHSRGFLYIM